MQTRPTTRSPGYCGRIRIASYSITSSKVALRWTFCARSTRNMPATTFLVLTNHANPQYRRACLEAGATHFFDKSLEFHKIKAAVAAVSARQP